MIMDEEDEIDWLTPWLVITITLIGGGLRVFLLGKNGLGLDEALNLWLSNHSIVYILQWIGQLDQHPPLYNLLLHFWADFNGNTPSDVRMLSAFFGTLTIPVIYLIGKRLSGIKVGLAAAVILAVSPFNIRVAQETNVYTYLMFNASMAIYALVRLLTDSRSSNPIGSQFREYLHAWCTTGPIEPDTAREFSYKKKTRHQTGWRAWVNHHRWLPIQSIETDLAWIVFIVFSAATLLSDNTAVLFILATNIFVLGLLLYQKIKNSEPLPAFQAPSLGNWMKAQIAIFLLWSPWIFSFIRQASRIYQEFWIPNPSWDSIIQTLSSFLNDSAPGQSSQEKIISILSALVLCVGLVTYYRKKSQFMFLAALIAIPFLGELVVSIRRPIFLDRTLIWVTIPLFLLLVAGIAQNRFRIFMVAWLAVLGTINLFSVGDYYRSMQKEEWDNVAGNVANFVQKDDLILFNATLIQIPFDYYFKPFEEQYFLQVEKHGIPVDMFDRGVLLPKMTESDVPRLISLLNGHNRVWLVYSQNSNTDPLGLIKQILASKMKLFYQRDFYDVQIQFYASP